jgi:LacI family transcriptional regulator
MKEVADLAGVAISSVSRVLSRHPDVSDAMRERVNKAVEQLGYEPDFVAQSLRRQSTRSVGFVMANISNPLLAEIAQGAESSLRQRGFTMMITDSEGEPAQDAQHIRLFSQRRVDAMLLSLAAEDDADTLNMIRGLQVPIVVVDRDLPPEIQASAVVSDHRQGMTEAVDHLLDLGHRRIGLINGADLRPTRERLGALQDAYAARDLDPTYTEIAGEITPEQGQAAMAEMLDAADPPTAVITGANRFLLGALREIRDRGLRVGEDISLVSCDAIDVTEIYDPPIAVVARDNREMGRRAGQLALSLLDDDDAAPQVVVLPTTFVPRPSCGPVPVAR